MKNYTSCALTPLTLLNALTSRGEHSRPPLPCQLYFAAFMIWFRLTKFRSSIGIGIPRLKPPAFAWPTEGVLKKFVNRVPFDYSAAVVICPVMMEIYHAA